MMTGPGRELGSPAAIGARDPALPAEDDVISQPVQEPAQPPPQPAVDAGMQPASGSTEVFLASASAHSLPGITQCRVADSSSLVVHDGQDFVDEGRSPSGGGSRKPFCAVVVVAGVNGLLVDVRDVITRHAHVV